ncbi:Disks large-associated protein 1 [Trichinella britovi]|uniref:Disks large-associated protein 1 n=1 Tax=Trichinella britovi TaxID=45882 RepID=A0A0V1D135_TRIBR|nr:Disks large-associated protein 1 [Trichinella britovi]
MIDVVRRAEPQLSAISKRSDLGGGKSTMNADEVKNVQHNGRDTPSLSHSKKANGTKCIRQSSIHRFFRRLTPRGGKNSEKTHSPASSQIHQSQQSMGENCAHVNNSQPTTTVANGNLDNAQRSPATSVGADLRRSLNQMFHFGTKSKANRAASDHQLAINRVDMDSADLCPVKLDKGVGETVRSEEDLLVLQGKRKCSDSADKSSSAVISSSGRVRTHNMASPSFSSDVLASMTRPLATFCSESNVHAGELSPTEAVGGPSRAPSYLRVSCAVSGYRDVGRYSASSSPRLLSRPPMVCGRTTVSGMPIPADQLFEFNSPPSERAVGLSSPLIGQKFATPLSIREILESFNRLSLKDNSPVYGLMVAGRRLTDAPGSGSSSPESTTVVEKEPSNCCPLDDGAKQQEPTPDACTTTTTTTTTTSNNNDDDDDDKRIVVSQNDSYQLLAQQQRKRLEDLCKQAELWQAESPPEAAAELIRIVIGKVTLLLKKKFRKFEELVDKHMNPVDGEPPVRMDDLEGFWSMVLMEIADVDSCFSAVQKAKDNGWLVEENSSDLTPFRCESQLSEANMDIKQLIKCALKSKKSYELLLHAIKHLCMLFNLAEDYCANDSKSSGSTKLRRNSNGKWKTTPTMDSDYVTRKRLQGRQFLRAARMKLKQTKEQQQATENKDDIHIFIS